MTEKHPSSCPRHVSTDGRLTLSNLCIFPIFRFSQAQVLDLETCGRNKEQHWQQHKLGVSAYFRWTYSLILLSVCCQSGSWQQKNKVASLNFTSSQFQKVSRCHCQGESWCIWHFPGWDPAQARSQIRAKLVQVMFCFPQQHKELFLHKMQVSIDHSRIAIWIVALLGKWKLSLLSVL